MDRALLLVLNVIFAGPIKEHEQQEKCANPLGLLHFSLKREEELTILKLRLKYFHVKSVAQRESTC